MVFKDRNLLLGSKTTDNFVGLREILEGRWRTFDKRLRESDKKIQKLFLDKTINDIIVAAFAEWIHDDSIPIVTKEAEGGRIICELCNSNLCKELYSIRNIHNENKMKVGSTCVNKFGTSESQAMLDSMREQKKLQFLVSLTSLFPDIMDVYHLQKKQLDTLPVLIPNPLFSNFQKSVLGIYKNAKNYDESIEESISAQQLKIRETIDSANSLGKEVAEWIRCQNEQLTIPSVTVAFIKKGHGEKALNNLRKTGALITAENFSLMANREIVEQRWLDMIISSVSLVHEQPFVNVEAEEYLGNWGYSFDVKQIPKMRIFLQHKKIESKMAQDILFGNRLILREVLRASQVTSTVMCALLVTRLHEKGIHYIGYSEDRNEVYFYRMNNAYYIAQLFEYVNVNLEWLILRYLGKPISSCLNERILAPQIERAELYASITERKNDRSLDLVEF